MRGDSRLYDPWYCSRISQIERTSTIQSVARTSLLRQIQSDRSSLWDKTSRPRWLQVEVFPTRVTDPEKGDVSAVLVVSTDVTSSIMGSVDGQSKAELRAYRDLRGLQQFPVTQPFEFSYKHDLDGRFIEVCDHSAKVFGVDQSQVSRYAIYDIFDDVYAKELVSESKRGFQAVKLNTWNVFLARDAKGQAMRVEVEASRIPYGGTEIVHGRARQLSPVLVDTVGRYSRVIEGGQVAGWDRHVGSNKFSVSREWKAQLGIHPDQDVTYEQFVEHIAPADKDRVAEGNSKQRGGTRLRH